VNALDEVDWQALTHAYGSAGDLPRHLRALTSPDTLARDQAYEALYSSVCHQTSAWEASAQVAAVLIELAGDPATPDRHRILEFLAALAIGHDRWLLPGSFPVAKERRDVARKASLTAAELERELQQWVDDAPTDRLRRSRAITVEFQDPVVDRDGQRWALDAYDSVRRGVPVYRDASDSEDRKVRLWAAYLLGWFPEEQAGSLPHLVRRVEVDPDSSVAATAAIAIGLIAPAAEVAPWQRLRRWLGDEESLKRWAGAIALARQTASPDFSVVRALYDCVGGADRLPHDVPYLDGDLASLAALTLAKLQAEAAPERLEVLAGRLASWSAERWPDAIVQALLQIAFPDGPIPDQTRFSQLTAEQRAVVRALTGAPDVWKYRDVRELVGGYNLPEERERLRRWARAG
jgi:HEAT repeat protein